MVTDTYLPSLLIPTRNHRALSCQNTSPGGVPARKEKAKSSFLRGQSKFLREYYTKSTAILPFIPQSSFYLHACFIELLKEYMPVDKRYSS